MSRRPQQPPVEATQGELEEEEEEAISGVGEGDELMEDVQDQEEGYSSSTPTSTLTWISWFCSLPGHEYFCEVAEDFIEDDFNLTGLNVMVPFWKEAMEMVLDVEPDEDTSKIPDVSIVEASAELLYGLVHQRFILTRAGLQAMEPAELDMVDWRGRWFEDDDSYDETEEDERDRPMEDFDDGHDVDDDEEEEEEEEEEDGRELSKGRTASYSQQHQTPPTSPPSSAPPRTPRDDPLSPVGGDPISRVKARSCKPASNPFKIKNMARSNLRVGLNKGHPTTPIEKAVKPSHRKGIQSTRTKFVRSVIREVAGFSPYERRVMELLRNSKDKKARKLSKKRLGTLLRSKRKLEELATVIQESRRAGH
ncbi:hypothetical protein EW026_g144 [Hermanssonia centrifuga]|uniref:60S ribosomal protein L36 n=2 Tax=Hermanssonia centrifuga TaxID=98765 RepID=A0A4S4KVD1_9APHY|nr:hypothetical protein EW026_g144 [Hermanssonia centrifuga]